MNCPSRTDEPLEGDGYNQNPNALANDLTTREDLNGRANGRALRRSLEDEGVESIHDLVEDTGDGKATGSVKGVGGGAGGIGAVEMEGEAVETGRVVTWGAGYGRSCLHVSKEQLVKMKQVMVKFAKFVGPGFMVAVAYIDPGNYATDVAAGATYRFKLLFIVLMSNVFAIFLQSLCIKLGTVSGLNLAEACRAFLPKWMNYALYILAEGAIIATDIAEVIGTAIAINLLIPQIPLVAGCALSILDVLILLVFYPGNGEMRRLRYFEIFVAALVLGVVVCFCIQLSLIKDTPVGEVFKGYLPSKAIVEQKGLYQACGILGATVMPHSLYLGSGIVQPRLLAYDKDNNIVKKDFDLGTKEPYYPSLPAIKFCLKYSYAELAICLFTFALFVNSAILIVAGSALYNNPAAPEADLFGIYDLLVSSISKGAGTIFALALLLSGTSAGIVCTIAGQMVSEGALNWTIRPWLRRLVTRSLSITPSIIIAGAVGREGLSTALNASQVALSIVLPFVTAPLIYFTCRNKYMTVRCQGRPIAFVNDDENGRGNADAAMESESVYEHEGAGLGAEMGEGTKMRNHWITAAVAGVIWTIMAAMNVANLVLLGKGDGV
ncbi:putative transporter protein smf2 protein [Botrytis fragariae]|uniref:Putative transporter protein smf2 protein n=1 Tax=Botrytis fragariae TaxID=1964551 RepID=A0A8H6B4S3_9HELO|nr:putative transporter protein smf2 protein [Botrytis fragariae]KAF5879413.1 putative transporter protein smf2 protein [Botrytis fragariae]